MAPEPISVPMPKQSANGGMANLWSKLIILKPWQEKSVRWIYCIYCSRQTAAEKTRLKLEQSVNREQWDWKHLAAGKTGMNHQSVASKTSLREKTNISGKEDKAARKKSNQRRRRQACEKKSPAEKTILWEKNVSRGGGACEKQKQSRCKTSL